MISQKNRTQDKLITESSIFALIFVMLRCFGSFIRWPITLTHTNKKETYRQKINAQIKKKYTNKKEIHTNKKENAQI